MTARRFVPGELVDVVKVAIRVAADAPLPRSQPAGARALVKRSLVDDLRSKLDRAGFGDDWRTLQAIVREEERTPEAV